ncbi:MAG: hypothetical protein ACKO68_06385 [Bacteroidota bacterium]
MNALELLLLKLGASFVLSKFLPYFLFTSIGLAFAMVLFRKLQSRGIHRLVNTGLSTVLAILPLTLYFSFFPIYQGDVMSLGYHPKSSMVFPFESGIVVVALPGCKYCSESTKLMNSIHHNFPVQTQYWVLGTDSLDVAAYDKLLTHKIICRSALQQKQLLPVTEGSFPTFLWIKNHRIHKAWHNNDFGALAMQEIKP